MALERLSFAVTTHVFVSDTFTLTLLLDEESGHFRCSCKPPHVTDTPEVQRACARWSQQIAVGWLARSNGGERSQVRVDLKQEDYGWFGTIIADH
jgi:hypothetical protein